MLLFVSKLDILSIVLCSSVDSIGLGLRSLLVSRFGVSLLLETSRFVSVCLSIAELIALISFRPVYVSSKNTDLPNVS